MSENIPVSRERLIREWEMWNDIAEKYRFQTVMSIDEHIFIKTAQEVRNMIVRLLCGEFTGKNFETTKEEVEKILQIRVRINPFEPTPFRYFWEMVDRATDFWRRY